MHIERELFESSLASARSTLHLLGLPDHEVQSLIERFRTHNLALIEQLHPYRHDREKFINFTRQGREQLMAQLHKGMFQKKRIQGWLVIMLLGKALMAIVDKVKGRPQAY